VMFMITLTRSPKLRIEFSFLVAFPSLNSFHIPKCVFKVALPSA
jgi:hypothetical protein